MLDKTPVPLVRDEAAGFLPEQITWPKGIRAEIISDPATYRLLSTEVSLNAQASRDVCCGQTGLWRSLELSQQSVTVDLRALGRTEVVRALQERLQEVPGQQWASRTPILLLSLEQAVCSTLSALTGAQRTRIDLGAAGELALTQLASKQRRSAFVATSLGSFCEPLGLEFATTPSPIHGLLLPAGAAPLVLCLDVRQFVDSARVDHEGLCASVEGALLLADELMDDLCWPLAVQSWDVFLNRRLALLPIFVGQCVLDQNLAPGSGAATELVEQILCLMTRAAARASARLAKLHGSFPAMSPHQVLQGAAGRPGYSEWRERWLKITAQLHYRHRQAVFLSLSELWPSSQRDNPEFIALLPPILRAHGLALGKDWSALRMTISAQQRLLRLISTMSCGHKLVPTAR